MEFLYKTFHPLFEEGNSREPSPLLSFSGTLPYPLLFLRPEPRLHDGPWAS